MNTNRDPGQRRLEKKRARLLSDPRLQGFPRDLIDEYILEAEHQEGLEYWDLFETPDDLITDVTLYQENLGDKGLDGVL